MADKTNIPPYSSGIVTPFGATTTVIAGTDMATFSSVYHGKWNEWNDDDNIVMDMLPNEDIFKSKDISREEAKELLRAVNTIIEALAPLDLVKEKGARVLAKTLSGQRKFLEEVLGVPR